MSAPNIQVYTTGYPYKSVLFLWESGASFTGHREISASDFSAAPGVTGASNQDIVDAVDYVSASQTVNLATINNNLSTFSNNSWIPTTASVKAIESGNKPSGFSVQNNNVFFQVQGGTAYSGGLPPFENVSTTTGVGKVVPQLHDTFGRQIIAAHDASQGVLLTNEVAPAVSAYSGPTTLTSLTALGASEAIDISTYEHVSYLLTLSAMPATNGYLSGVIEQGHTTSNWGVSTLHSTATTGMTILNNMFRLADNQSYIASARAIGAFSRLRVVNSGASSWILAVSVMGRR